MESILRFQSPVAGWDAMEALDRREQGAMRLRGWDQAGHSCLTIEPHSTCPTLTLGTTFFGPYEASIFTQRVKQTLTFCGCKLIGTTIDGRLNNLERQ